MDIINSSFTPIAEGQTGSAVATTLNAAMAQVYDTVQYDIFPADVISNAVEYNHGKGTRKIRANLYDKDWVEQTTSGIFSLPNANNWKLAVDNAIDTVLHLIIDYKA
jgi:hypothetical protein